MAHGAAIKVTREAAGVDLLQEAGLEASPIAGEAEVVDVDAG